MDWGTFIPQRPVVVVEGGCKKKYDVVVVDDDDCYDDTYIKILLWK